MPVATVSQKAFVFRHLSLVLFFMAISLIGYRWFEVQVTFFGLVHKFWLVPMAFMSSCFLMNLGSGIAYNIAAGKKVTTMRLGCALVFTFFGALIVLFTMESGFFLKLVFVCSFYYTIREIDTLKDFIPFAYSSDYNIQVNVFRRKAKKLGYQLPKEIEIRVLETDALTNLVERHLALLTLKYKLKDLLAGKSDKEIEDSVEEE